ncbi:MAG: AFG1/ZapE family ATPase [Myxococcota bacterium]
MMEELRHPGAKPDCPNCRGLGAAVARKGEYAVAVECSCLGPCPLCKGTGLVATEAGFRAPRRRCVCQRVRARMRAFDAVGIPGRYAQSTLGSFVVTGRVQHEVMKQVSAYLSAFDPEERPGSLVLHGEVGRGKTHLLVALLRELVLTRGVRARFVEFTHLLADLKAGFDHGRGMASLIDPLVDVDILAIDELGKGRNTEFEGTVLDEIVSRRYNAMRPLLATTNYHPGPALGRAVANAAAVQAGIAARESLADRVGDRVYSRLRETARFVAVLGDDFREHRGRRLRTSSG